MPPRARKPPPDPRTIHPPGPAAAAAARPGDTELRRRLGEHVRVLGLVDLTDAELDAHLAAALEQRPSYTQLLERLLGQAAARKRERCCERRIVESGITVRKTLATFDWAFQPKLDRAVVEELAGLGFAQKQRDLLITGKPGTGKSHILMSIALLACEAGHLVRYARFVDLLTELHAGLADGSYERRLRRWARLPFVVLDDVGMGQVPAHADTPTAAHMLWSLIDLRHQRTTTAMSSNIKLSEWGKYLGDATVTAAILDRLAMTSIRLDIDGPSYRQHIAHERAEHDDQTDAS